MAPKHRIPWHRVPLGLVNGAFLGTVFGCSKEAANQARRKVGIPTPRCTRLCKPDQWSTWAQWVEAKGPDEVRVWLAEFAPYMLQAFNGLIEQREEKARQKALRDRTPAQKTADQIAALRRSKNAWQQKQRAKEREARERQQAEEREEAERKAKAAAPVIARVVAAASRLPDPSRPMSWRESQALQPRRPIHLPDETAEEKAAERRRIADELAKFEARGGQINRRAFVPPVARPPLVVSEGWGIAEC